jgi:GWxTD domain-containing protein
VNWKSSIAVVVCMAAASAGNAAPPRDAAGAAGHAVGSILQPGIGRGDFEFAFDAVARQPGAPGHIVVRGLVQIPVQALLDQTHADRADVRVVLRAFDAQAAFAALAAAPQERIEAGTGSDSVRASLEQTDAAIDELLAEFDAVSPSGEAERRSRIEVDSRRKLLDTDYRLFDLALEVAPGDYVLEARVENLSRRKRGLLDRLRKRPQSAVARVLVRVPDLTQVPALADLAFKSGHGTHSDYAARLYGLLNDSLHVETTLFGKGTYDVRLQAAGRDGDVAWRDSMRVDADGAHDLRFSTSVNAMPAGQYVVQVTARGAEGGAIAARSYDVAWSLVTWTKSRRDLDVEAELALSEAEFDAYRAMPVGEKERFLEDFWRRRDPTPETAINETLDEFQRRVAYADLNFSEGRRGALSDRGRVYVRYGAPGEIQAEAVPSHLAGHGAEEALEKVDDAYVASEHRQNEDPDQLGSVRGASASDRSIRTQERSRVIGNGNEVTAYELWLYSGGGHPLFPEDKGVTVDSGLRVLFVDVSGYGRYRLRKASARLDIRGLGANY